MAQLLITGAAGFIGSHTCLVLLKAGHRLVLIDNYSNSSPEALKRVPKLAGREAEGRIKIIEGDVCCS
ncbi:MAG: GDP-mannose 4,6-dehydratase, partial [Prochlorococcus sp.]